MLRDLVDVAIGIDSARAEGNSQPTPQDDEPAAELTAEELLGRAVLRLRLYHRWSQCELERRSGVDQSTISRLETGHRSNLGAGRFSAVLRALQVGEAVLLPRADALARTTLERMLYGDPWERAVAEADRRISRRRSA